MYTLYFLDGKSFAVTRRHWFEARIGYLAFNSAGTMLVVEDDEEAVHFLDVELLQPIKTVSRLENIVACPARDVLAGVIGSPRRREIQFLCMNDASEDGEIKFPEGLEINAMNFSADCQRLGVLTKAETHLEEEKVESYNLPRQMKGLERNIYQQKHDGKMSRLLIFSVPSGKLLSSRELWYAPSEGNTELLLGEDRDIVLSYENLNAEISPEGEIRLFKTETLGYGRGVSPGHNAFIMGAMRKATLVRFQGSDWREDEIQLDVIQGWPEYFANFVFAPNGGIFGVTSAYRLIVIDANGNLKQAIPVF